MTFRSAIRLGLVALVVALAAGVFSSPASAKGRLRRIDGGVHAGQYAAASSRRTEVLRFNRGASRRLTLNGFWTNLLGVGVYSYARGTFCVGRATLGCTIGLRPPIYIERDVLANATYEFNHRGDPQPDASESLLATRGINVLLHEYAHAEDHVWIEAMAQCYAGQWLADFEGHYGFTAAIEEADWTAFWDDYSQRLAARDGYGDFTCATQWDAPNFFSGQSVTRRIRPITNPSAASLTVEARWMSDTALGSPVTDFPAGITRVYFNATLVPDWVSPHLVQIEFVADSQPFSLIAFTAQPRWYWLWGSTNQNDGTPLPNGAWMARIWIDHSFEGWINFSVG